MALELPHFPPVIGAERPLWRNPSAPLEGLGIIANSLEVFKDWDHRMHRHADGPHRILFYSGDAETGNKSFTVDTLNRMFVKGGAYFVGDVDDRQILPRAVSLFDALQNGYHTGQYPRQMAAYPYAAEEYPDRYLHLVAGLSDAALEAIEAMDDFSVTREAPDLGKLFVARLREDRVRLHNTLCADPRFDDLRV